MHRGAFDVLANLAGHPQVLQAGSGEVLLETEPGVRAEGLQVTLPARSAAIIRLH